MALKRLVFSLLAAALAGALGGQGAWAASVHPRVHAHVHARSAEAMGAACDEPCLKGFAFDYMTALAAHDPTGLKLAADVRFTENTRPLKLGDGLWGTITALGAYRHYLADPATGEVALFSAVEEQGVPALFLLRLRIQDFKISEAETIVVRKQDVPALFNPLRTLQPLWEEVAPLEERIGRDALVKVADSYFDALVQGSAALAPFDEDCMRFENGVQTVNNPASRPAPGARNGFNPGAMGCREQIDNQVFAYISRIEPRRFVVVDESHQAVLALAMFHHNGRTTTVETPNNGTYRLPAAVQRPFDEVVGEAFRIKDGKIREIEALTTSLPYGSDDGWEARR